MGKPNPVLVIAVARKWEDHPAIVQLHDAGHTILTDKDVGWSPEDCDLLLYEQAHGWHEALFEQAEDKHGNVKFPYVTTALVAARKRRKGRK